MKPYYFFISFLIMTFCASCLPASHITRNEKTLTPSSLLIPTNKPTVSFIPGFEDWSVMNPQAVEVELNNGNLTLTLRSHLLWFMNQRGVLMYKLIEGNFKITANVVTSKNSDSTQPPGGDGTVQLGGLMARNGNGGQENYVFIVVGDDGNGLSIETKNTTESFSKYNGPAWNSSNAELRICRVGNIFNLYKRHINQNESWVVAASFERPDLPSALQVGVNIYTDSAPDLRIQYQDLKIEAISTLMDCEMN